MTYLSAKDALDGRAKVIYRYRDGRTSKTFEALDCLAQLATHIPKIAVSGYRDSGNRLIFAPNQQ
jgi:hypothetical protein